MKSPIPQLRMLRVLCIATALLAQACTLTASPSAAAALPIDPLGRTECERGIGLHAVLAGSVNDLRLAWAIQTAVFGMAPGATPVRLELVWPPGYRATFTPALVITDSTGGLVAHAGDRITGGCPGNDAVFVTAREIAPPSP